MSFNHYSKNNIYSTEHSSSDLFSPEKSLWKSVLSRLIIDAASNNPRTENKIAKSSALRYFNKNNEDFKVICQYCELSPHWVLKKILFALENPSALKKYYSNKKKRNTKDIKDFNIF